MKHKLFLFFSLALFGGFCSASEFQEGQDYVVIDNPKSSELSITEYFSFYCYSCREFEPVMEQVKSNFPNVKFEKFHISFTGDNMAPKVSKAYATMLALGIEDRMRDVFYRQFLELKLPPKNVEDIKNIFIENGVTARDFDDSYNSFSVELMVQKFDEGFYSSGIKSSPSVIVNNQYLISPSNDKSAEYYVELMKYLIEYH